MADAVVRLRVESSEYDQKLSRATQQLQHMEKEVRRTGATFAYADKEELAFAQSLGQMETQATSAKGKIAEMTKAFTELSLQYKHMTDEEKSSPFGQGLADSLEQLKGRIKDSKSELSGIESSLGGTGNAMSSVFEGVAQKVGIPMDALKNLSSQGFGGIAQSAASAGKAIMTGLGPIGALIAAIVLAVKQLVDAFKRNEDAMTAVQKIAAPFKAVWQSIQRLFDDIVKVFVNVYNNLEKAAGGFDGFKTALAPAATLIAAVRASVAVLGTVLTDLAKGVAFVSGKVREAMSGSKVGTFFQNITDTVQGFFKKFTAWTAKIANSKLGKALGLDSLYLQLKEIANAQDELTKSNKRIADSENELNKLRRQNVVSNANAEREIAKLREQASEKDKFSADERIKMLEKAAQLEEGIMSRNVNEKKKELEIIKLKNSLTQSGTSDLNAQAQAEAAVIQAETEFYNKKRALQRQLQSARNEDAKGGGGATEASAPAEGSIAAQEAEVQRLTELWKNASDELRDGYKKQLDEAKATLDEMMGKTKDVASEAPSMKGPERTRFEEMQQSIRIKLADDAESVDTSSLNNLLTVAIQNGIDAFNPNFEELMGKIGEGFNIPDSAWEELTAQINEHLAELGIDPIEIDVKTGNVEKVTKDAEAFKTAWSSAAGAIGQVGGALQQIDDPGAKIAGIIMEAVANVASGFAQMLASPSATSEAWGWIALAVSGVTTMISTISAIKSVTSGNYASGGIIGGNSYSGDNMRGVLPNGDLIGLNSGEVVLNAAQQSTLAENLAGNNPMQNLQLSTEISGTNLRIVMNNDNRSKGGSRGYYANIH